MVPVSTNIQPSSPVVRKSSGGGHASSCAAPVSIPYSPDSAMTRNSVIGIGQVLRDGQGIPIQLSAPFFRNACTQ